MKEKKMLLVIEIEEGSQLNKLLNRDAFISQGEVKNAFREILGMPKLETWEMTLMDENWGFINGKDLKNWLDEHTKHTSSK